MRIPLSSAQADRESDRRAVHYGGERHLSALRRSPTTPEDRFRVGRPPSFRTKDVKWDCGHPLARSAPFDSSDKETDGRQADLHHLLLLPLLISHVDPSLPIILFSSTQQRALVKALSARPNVVTCFSKPLVATNGSARSPDAWIDDLLTAIRLSLMLHKIRCVWRTLKSISDRVGFKCLEPHLAFKTRSNEYTVTAKVVRQLSREYQRLLERQHYADALAVPDNLLESIGADIAERPEYPGVGAVFLQRKRGGNEPWNDVLQCLFTDESLWDYSKQLRKQLCCSCFKVFAGTSTYGKAEATPTPYVLWNFWEKNEPGSGWHNQFKTRHAQRFGILARGRH